MWNNFNLFPICKLNAHCSHTSNYIELFVQHSLIIFQAQASPSPSLFVAVSCNSIMYKVATLLPKNLWHCQHLPMFFFRSLLNFTSFFRVSFFIVIALFSLKGRWNSPERRDFTSTDFLPRTVWDRTFFFGDFPLQPTTSDDLLDVELKISNQRGKFFPPSFFLRFALNAGWMTQNWIGFQVETREVF